MMESPANTRTAQRILLIGNHTCGNRGDAAILRGLIAGLQTHAPTAEIVVTSRFPISSSFLLGREVLPDVMADWHIGSRYARHGRFMHKVRTEFVPTLMSVALSGKQRWLRRLLPAPIARKIEWLRRFDLVIQVGGSFFVDLYGYRQFETPFAAMLADRPVLLLGHSVGPFAGRRYRHLISQLLAHARQTALREPVSRAMMEEAGLPMATVTGGSDTAWLVPVEAAPPRMADQLAGLTAGRPAIAVTLRDLAPFNRRLGITQADFERGFARLADALIAQGHDIVACSTCTGIDSYHRDDRMAALRVRAQVSDPARFHVIMDEYNDIELGQLIGQCALLIGTRLHSAIIAMNFGTPAIALNYEHKSAGILAQLDLPELAMPVHSVVDGSLLALAERVLADLEATREQVNAAVAREREAASAMIADALDLVGGQETER